MISQHDEAYKKAYGFAYWCLEQGIVVEWLMNYKGGAFMIDYRGDLFDNGFTDVNLVGEPDGVVTGKFPNVKYEIVDKVNTWQIYEQVYKVIQMDTPLSIAIYTEVADIGGDIVPLGIDFRQILEDGKEYIIKYNSTVNQAVDPNDLIYFDETHVYNENELIDEAKWGIDLNQDGLKNEIPVQDVLEPFTLKVGGGAEFDENQLFPTDTPISEESVGVDLDGNGSATDTVLVQDITPSRLKTTIVGIDFDETIGYNFDDTINEATYGFDLDDDGDFTGIVAVQDIDSIKYPIDIKVGWSGPFWDETQSHEDGFKVSEVDFNIDFNLDKKNEIKGDVKIKDIKARPTKNTDKDHYWVDMNDDGDYDDILSGADQYFVDITQDNDWDDTMTFGINSYQIDLNANGLFTDIISLPGATYQVDLNVDGDWDDLVGFSASGGVLPGSGNFAGLAIDGNGANVFRTSIMNGCTTKLSIGDIIDTEPGNMAGPTTQAIEYRLDNNLKYVVCPIVNTLDVNGRKEVTIVGFAYFELIDVTEVGNGNNASAEVKAKYIDVALLEAKAEDPSKEVVASILTEAGIPFSWVHDRQIMNDELLNFDWLHSHHEDCSADVANKISEFGMQGGFVFAQCWITERIDGRIKDYNEQNGTDVRTFAFKEEYCEVDPKETQINDKDSGDFDLTTDYDNLDVFELMAVQNHTTSIPGFGGKTTSFYRPSIRDDVHQVGIIDADSTKYITGDYGEGHFTFLAGHDAKTVEGERLVLDNVFAGSQIEKNISMKPNLGCLDLDNSENEDKDETEYGINIKIPYTAIQYKAGDYIYTLPGNIPGNTNLGVPTRYSTDPAATMDAATGLITPNGSARGIIVPIVIPETYNNVVYEKYTADNAGRTTIYDLKGRSRVKLLGLGLFLLSDVNVNPVQRSELSTNPADTTDKGIYNGQVRGIFVKYIELPEALE